jgi:ABC-type nitrate/sulfonate/bicarbonate transport system substrate-binding protein
MTTFLLIVHGLLAVALLGAVTHQAIGVLAPARKDAGAFVGRMRAVFAPAYVAARKKTLVRYVRALGAALKFIRDPANRKTVVKIIVEATDVSADIAEQTLKLFFEPERNVLPKQVEMNPKGLAQAIGFMSEAGAIKQPLPEPERFVDLQYLQAAGVK